MSAGDGIRACEPDSRTTALRVAVDRLRRELGDYRATLTDREVAERELTQLERACDHHGPPPDPAVLRDALLLVAAAVGSIRTLASALAELRDAVELFDTPGDCRLPHLRQPTP